LPVLTGTVSEERELAGGTGFDTPRGVVCSANGRANVSRNGRGGKPKGVTV